jgi:hypothetical protein
MFLELGTFKSFCERNKRAAQKHIILSGFWKKHIMGSKENVDLNIEINNSEKKNNIYVLNVKKF